MTTFTMKPWRDLSLMATLAAAVACGGGQDETAPADASAMSVSLVGAEPVTLRERDVERFLTVMREFRRLGLEAGGAANDPAAAVTGMGAAWAANREAMDILGDNDFDVPTFQRVTYSIMLALAASEMDGGAAKMREGAAQLEAMKGKLPPEMYEAMKKTQEQSVQLMQSMMNQPDGNIELVRRFKADIEALNEGRG